MKKIEYTTENYEFKKAMQQNILENIQPLLIENRFVSFSKNKYIRECDGLFQLISFNITKNKLKAFAMYIPAFFPWDNIMNYGIEITGSSGLDLLKGKYFATFYEDNHHDIEMQLLQYENEHVSNIEKLILALKEGIISEMDRINSFFDFVDELESENARFFNHEYDSHFRNGIPHRYIIAVYKCYNEDFTDGIKILLNILDIINDNDNPQASDYEIKVSIEKILESLECELAQRKTKFADCIDQLTSVKRKKYKLKK